MTPESHGIGGGEEGQGDVGAQQALAEDASSEQKFFSSMELT